MSRESLVRAIKKRRNLAGLTQDEVAELCGMSKKTYQRIEQCKTDIKLSQYESIIRALNVSEIDLLLDKLGYDNASEVDVLAASRLLPQKTRRLLIEFLISLHADLSINNRK
ncbi:MULTISPECIES: helix-turn-helix domain-containing protein [Vibrio]|uniref:Helix-turn-helix transcriptional regulator n=1 Tax=Vibrio aestuarianus TaxID=28171 RepID=A0ABD7YSD7_9VIBR|nr:MULTISPECIES: helix-turn-helix transcriptional regulator [Vibrio]AQM21502.1 hypothetical protein PN51_17030 [Vibrio anguillarum]AUB86128.1 transcriptional regulator [Vibrio anguillarum]AUB89566.1 transcriptional regulator [Vibrio anguillarum]AUB93008.1 transcriptional regulator [Vibrio anguillarum]AUB96440.1 transcriptional regulator [Vibrio anguillarum]